MTLPSGAHTLQGRRILVTRAAHQAGKLRDGLRALGAEPVEVPVLEIRSPEDFSALDTALRSLSSYNWLIFTSANTVQALAERTAAVGLSLSVSPQTQIAAIGAATAEAVRKIGLPVAFAPKNYVAESLLEELSEEWAGKRVLLARAAVARDVIPEALRSAGAIVDVVDAYRNVLPDEAPQQLQSALARRIDAATFTSSSSATYLAEAATRAGIAFPLPGVLAVSIGPITSATLRERGWEPAAEADPHDIPGLIAVVAKLLTSDL